MTASSSIISLGNRALLMIGARAQVASLTEGSTESDAISVLYQPTFEQLARTAPWDCLRQQAGLSLIAAAQGTPENQDGTTLPLPPVPWLYQYAYPSNCLQIRFILPPFTNSTPTGTVPISTSMIGAGAWVPGVGQIPYAVAYSTDTNNNPIETVLTNQTQALAVYTVNQSNPVIFDSLFEQALVASLAAYLVPALSLNIALMDRAVKQANETIVLARTRDANEGVTSMNRNAQWMRARMGSGISLDGPLSPSQYGVWADMSWPGG